MLNNIGEISLFVSLLVSIIGLFSLSSGTLKKDNRLIHVGSRCIFSICILITISIVSLAYLLITKDYANLYVAKNTSNDLSVLYSFTALWAGQEGSLLLWSWILSIYVAIIAFSKSTNKLIPTTQNVALFVLAFFLFLIVFIESPFQTLPQPLSNGRGLNPILQNIYMAIHPLTLYVGYIALTIPFAFSVASVLSKDGSDDWVRIAKRWTYFSWIFLSGGLLLGSRWAYLELGWGGYWAWDPVENIALMPWLVLIAFIHSSMAQEKRSLLRRWNVVLIFIAFFLSIFGTFITRSGLISSVHSFAQSPIGTYFIIFILFILIAGVFAYYKNKKFLSSDEDVTSLVSKESFFIFNNIFFLVITLTVFLGTVFPILSEAIIGEKILVGPSFYNTVNFPNVLLLMLLMSVAPVIPWGKGNLTNLYKFIFVPLLISLLIGIFSFVLLGKIQTSLIILLSSLVTTILVKELIIDFQIQLRNKMRIKEIISIKIRRYYAFLIHFGIVLLVLGINFSSSFALKYDVSLKKGESAIIENYKVELVDTYMNENEAKNILGAKLILYDADRKYLLNPEQNNYKYEGNRSINKETEVAIHSTLMKDYYVILMDPSPKGNFNFKIYINPMVSLLWIGSLISIFGGTMLFMKKRGTND
ncbi:MAG: cytochrome c-type biogenesis CcmF C-terminal domain-containing protein [Thermodesulfobacteriota bacterium]|nr:cytochrome c-type biogenesis CcmF C-terminal domain-containing protein [Thermodesulfobacteriota bacterium]